MAKAHRDAFVDSVVEQFLLLTPARQLKVHEAIRSHLAAPVVADLRDKVIAQRKAAVEALTRAAKVLKLPADRAPTITEYKHARTLTKLPTPHQVIKAYGRWRWAQDAYLGVLPGRTAVVVDSHKRIRGEPVVPALAAVTEWLGTNPSKRSQRAYGIWARERNLSLAPGERPYPSWGQVVNHLGIPWSQIVAAARGEDPMTTRSPRQRTARTFVQGDGGPHGLIVASQAQAILGLDRRSAWTRETARPDFPVAVLIPHRALRLWYRSDMEAYARNEPVPRRTLGELAPLYYTNNEIAAILGVKDGNIVTQMLERPEPTFIAGGAFLYLRTDVQSWIDKELAVKRALQDARSRRQGRRAGKKEASSSTG